MRRSFVLSKGVFGLALCLLGCIVGIVGATLAWPAVIAIVLGGMSTGQGLGVLALIPIGFLLAWLGYKMIG